MRSILEVLPGTLGWWLHDLLSMVIPICTCPGAADVDLGFNGATAAICPYQRGVPVLHLGPAELLLEQPFGVSRKVLNGPGVNCLQPLEGLAFLEIEIQVPAGHINFVKR